MATVALRIILNPGTSIQHLEGIAKQLDNFEQALLEIGLVISDFMGETFEQEGRGRWPPLKASTIQRKFYGGYLMPILQRTGATKGRAEGGEWQAGKTGGTSFKAWLPVTGYSRFHWSGTRFMPARDYAFIDTSVEPQIVNVIEEWILQGVA